MKRFLKKKWHHIPVGIVAVLMALVLIAGSAFAAFSFYTGTLSATVVEAVAVGAGTWDNLEPYGLNKESLDDVDIVFGTDTITITTLGSGKYVGDGFAAGEWIVIPLNIRNGSDGELYLTASVTGDTALVLKASYEVNTGVETDPIPAGHVGDFLAYDFKASGPWVLLDDWNAAVEGNSGYSGSAVYGAQVLFVKVIAPGDIVPGTYAVTLTLERS